MKIVHTLKKEEDISTKAAKEKHTFENRSIVENNKGVDSFLQKPDFYSQ